VTCRVCRALQFAAISCVCDARAPRSIRTLFLTTPAAASDVECYAQQISAPIVITSAKATPQKQNLVCYVVCAVGLILLLLVLVCLFNRPWFLHCDSGALHFFLFRPTTTTFQFHLLTITLQPHPLISLAQNGVNVEEAFAAALRCKPPPLQRCVQAPVYERRFLFRFCLMLRLFTPQQPSNCRPRPRRQRPCACARAGVAAVAAAAAACTLVHACVLDRNCVLLHTQPPPP